MMKKILFTALFCAIYGGLFAGYWTPGTGVVWNLDNIVTNSGGVVTYTAGAYIINDTLTIAQSDTIKINTNVLIKIAQNKSIYVFGTLIVLPPDSIKVTALDTTLKFIGFRFEQNSGASVLKKMIMEYGNSVRILNANIIVDSCIFRRNTLVTTISSGTISVSNSAPVISNCRFIGNRRSAIISAANGNASPVIQNNFFYNNNVLNENYPQINLGVSGASPIIIRNNFIIGNPLTTMSGGISVSNLLGTGSVSCIIENNNIRRNRYGIAFLGSGITGIVSGNLIDSNNTQGDPSLGGSGINFYNTSSTSLQVLKVKRNVIRWNLWGVTIQNYAKPILGIAGSPDTNEVGMNSIYGNNQNGVHYDLAYAFTGSDTIKAENNWWGTNIADSIEAHILSRNDSLNYGYVDFTPFLITSGTGNQSAEIPNAFSLSEPFPNPFNPSSSVSAILPERCFLELKIFDVNGKLIQTVFNGNLSPGKYSFNISLSNVSSGIYFIRMSAGSFFVAKKLLLLK